VLHDGDIAHCTRANTILLFLYVAQLIQRSKLSTEH